MARCEAEACEEEHTDLSFTCSYCLKNFCTDHRLPEKHGCIWLKDVNTLGPDWRNVDIDKLNDDLSSPEHSTSEKKQCDKCSNFTTPDHDLCLRCRRKEQTMSSKSPDMNADGSLIANDDTKNVQTETRNKRSIFEWVSSFFKR